MSARRVLIAALSGRALAASARRAGYAPLVVDAFADLDTRELSEATCPLPHALDRGFAAATLIPALSALADAASTPPVGLVLGPGFESDPALVAALSDRFTLIGCQASTYRAAKDPATFFALLAELGIPHPKTRPDPPPHPEGWLVKAAGGCGGTHIKPCRPGIPPTPGRYFQQQVDGVAISLLGIVGPKGLAFAVSRQWCNPAPGQPYRYGGAVAGFDVDADLEAVLVDMAVPLAKRLGLVGLVSFDVLLTQTGEVFLLEVNPRPGATLDVLDDDTGSLFQAHIAAAGGGTLDELVRSWSPKPKASAYVYADKGPLTPHVAAWPEWLADRPPPGARIARHAPIATVLAQAATADEAEVLCARRFNDALDLLYGQDQGKETPQ